MDQLVTQQTYTNQKRMKTSGNVIHLWWAKPLCRKTNSYSEREQATNPRGKLYSWLILPIIKGLSFAPDLHLSSCNIQFMILVTFFTYWLKSLRAFFFLLLFTQNLPSHFSLDKFCPLNALGILSKAFSHATSFPNSASLIFTVSTNENLCLKLQYQLLNAPAEAKSAPYSMHFCLCISMIAFAIASCWKSVLICFYSVPSKLLLG